MLQAVNNEVLYLKRMSFGSLTLDEKLVSIMRRNGLKGTFNLNAGLYPSAPITGNIHAKMTEEECKALFFGTENEVALHGYRHLPLAALDNVEMVYEVIEDRKALEVTYKKLIRGMAYPNGSYNDDVLKMLKACNIGYARTVEDSECFDLPEEWLTLRPTCHHNNPRLMELAREFAELNYGDDWTEDWYAKTPKLFCLWGHSSEFGRDENWDVIEEFAAYLGNRNDIWYATLGEIFEYTQAYKNLRFFADGSGVYNPSAIDVYIFYFGEKYIVRAGTTLELNKKEKYL